MFYLKKWRTENREAFRHQLKYYLLLKSSLAHWLSQIPLISPQIFSFIAFCNYMFLYRAFYFSFSHCLSHSNFLIFVSLVPSGESGVCKVLKNKVCLTSAQCSFLVRLLGFHRARPYLFYLMASFLNLGTTDILNWIILYCGRLSLCMVGCSAASLASTH